MNVLKDQMRLDFTSAVAYVLNLNSRRSDPRCNVTGETMESLSSHLAKVAAGDRSAFAALYQSTAAKLFGTVLRILGDRDLAKDVTQDVYVKIWQNAASFDAKKASPIAWMAAIARNRALDEVRRRRPQTVDIESEDLQIAADHLDPLAQRARNEDLSKLMGCLGALDDEKRQVVMLAYYHGYSREALSQRFGRPVPTIKTWLYRSLQQLRECLSS